MVKRNKTIVKDDAHGVKMYDTTPFVAIIEKLDKKLGKAVDPAISKLHTPSPFDIKPAALPKGYFPRPIKDQELSSIKQLAKTILDKDTIIPSYAFSERTIPNYRTVYPCNVSLQLKPNTPFNKPNFTSLVNFIQRECAKVEAAESIKGKGIIYDSKANPEDTDALESILKSSSLNIMKAMQNFIFSHCVMKEKLIKEKLTKDKK